MFRLFSDRTGTEERIMDRFIPRLASSHTYRARADPPWDDSLTNLGSTSRHEGRAASAVSRVSGTPVPRLGTLSGRPHEDAIRALLQFAPAARVLSFSPVKSCESASAGSGSPVFSRSSISPRTSLDSNISAMAMPTMKPKRNAQTHMPYRVLDAPGLTNDFYTNVVAWSAQTNRIAVGLASEVYLWRQDEVTRLLEMPVGHEISVVSFLPADEMVVATKEGNFFLFAQSQGRKLDEHINGQNGICCIAWCPSKPQAFFAGDDSGKVLYFEVQSSKLCLMGSFKAHQQQVCGIAVSYDGNQVSVGGNDNCCTIWDVSDIANPTQKFFLPHQAAVKALAYCPWSKSLLATGGGSKDRTIRFWHTNSGTLLDSIQTKGQITSLIWSTRKKQITLTFGFGDSKMPKLIAVYSYPKMDELIQVEATPNLRVLSAVPSPDSSAICVASNDETVRFYQLWNALDSVILESQEGSVFGSDLIDLCEGITKSGGSIR